MAYNNVIAGAGAGGDGYKIERSLRFNSADTAQWQRVSFLLQTSTQALYLWIKRSEGVGVIAAGWDGGVSYSGSIQFNSSDNTLQVSMGGSVAHTFKTNAVLRDVSSWYHVVAAWDRSASAADKVKAWINVAQTSSDTGISLGLLVIVKYGLLIMEIELPWYWRPIPNQLNGYLAEYHYTDGQALDETPSVNTTATMSGNQRIAKTI